MEVTRREAKEVNNQLNYKKQLQTKAQLKEREKQNFIQKNPAIDVDAIRRRVEAQKAKVAKDMVKLNAEISELLTASVNARMNGTYQRFKLMPILDQIDVLKR